MASRQVDSVTTVRLLTEIENFPWSFDLAKANQEIIGVSGIAVNLQIASNLCLCRVQR
jgi:hypothetical protein